MALFNRRTGIAGITVGALLCLVCGLPFIAALLGIGGLSLGAVLTDLPGGMKITVVAGGLIALVLLVVIVARRRSKPSAELEK